MTSLPTGPPSHQPHYEPSPESKPLQDKSKKTSSFDEHAIESVKNAKIDGKFKSYIPKISKPPGLPSVDFILTCIFSVFDSAYDFVIDKFSSRFSSPPVFGPLTLEKQNELNQKLYRAVSIHGSLTEISSLIKKGADVNYCPDKKSSVISMAVFYREKEVVKLLVENGARVIDDNGVNTISSAVAYGKHEIATMLYEMDSNRAEYAHEVKMLVHRFALKDVAGKSFEGYSLEITGLEFIDSANKFLAASKNIPQQMDKSNVQRSIDNAMTADSGLDLVNRGEIVCIQTSWRTEINPKQNSHAVSAAVFKVGNEYFFVKGNRGYAKGDYAIEVFKIGTPHNIDKAIKKLRENQESSYEGETYFKKGINADLKLEPYPNEKEYGIKHKDQSIGNCSWAATKLIFEIAAYASLRQNGVGHSEAVQQAHRLYKAFTSDDRARATDDFLSFLSVANAYLFDDLMRASGLPTVKETLHELIKDISVPKDFERLKKLNSYLGGSLADTLLETKTLKQGIIFIKDLPVLLNQISQTPELVSDPRIKEALAQCIENSIVNDNYNSFTSIDSTVEVFNQIVDSRSIFSKESQYEESLLALFKKAQKTWKDHPEMFKEFIMRIKVPPNYELQKVIQKETDELQISSAMDWLPLIQFEIALNKCKFPEDKEKFQDLLLKANSEAEVDLLASYVKQLNKAHYSEIFNFMIANKVNNPALYNVILFSIDHSVTITNNDHGFYQEVTKEGAPFHKLGPSEFQEMQLQIHIKSLNLPKDLDKLANILANTDLNKDQLDLINDKISTSIRDLKKKDPGLAEMSNFLIRHKLRGHDAILEKEHSNPEFLPRVFMEGAPIYTNPIALGEVILFLNEKEDFKNLQLVEESLENHSSKSLKDFVKETNVYGFQDVGTLYVKGNIFDINLEEILSDVLKGESKKKLMILSFLLKNGADPNRPLPSLNSKSISSVLVELKAWEQLEEFLSLPELNLSKQNLPAKISAELTPNQIVEVLKQS